MRKRRKTRNYWVSRPSPEQRAFVCAAFSVGLDPEIICREFPRGKKGLRVMTPDRLREHFADEVRDAKDLAPRIVALRLVERALIGNDRDAKMAQLAVFKSLPDWRQLHHSRVDEPEQLHVERLTDDERHELRRLLEKMEDEAE